MAYSLLEAAKATGKVKSTIFKACKSGKISYKKDDNGEYRIEASELHRVFPPVNENDEFSAEEETEKTIGNGEFSDGNGFGNRLLQQEVGFLREKLAGLEQAKEQERQVLAERIEDLRLIVDDLRGERDKLLGVLGEQAGSVKLLTDQRVQETAAATAVKAQEAAAGTALESAEIRQGRGFFGRFLRRGK